MTIPWTYQHVFRDLGYTYVLQDDCWSAGRDASGKLVADSTKFPHGLPYVTDQLHSMGLGFGIYSDAGALTCARFEGSLGHETIDAQTWASWGVSFTPFCLLLSSPSSRDFGSEWTQCAH